MVIDETDCRIEDGYGAGDLTEEVRREGVGFLYPRTLT